MKTSEITAQDEAIEILRGCLAEKMDKNPKYSARAFARDIKVSPAFISMLLAGKKKLSLERAQEVSMALGMTDRKRNHFLRTVALSSLPGKSSSAKEMEMVLFHRHERKDIFPLELDKFKFFSNWYNIAILDLTTCHGFQSDVAWIARRLQISPVTARDSVDRLIRLGLLKKENGRIIKTKSHISMPNLSPESSIRNFHQQMISKAQQALDQQEPEVFKRREISSMTMAVDARKINQAKKLIESFKNQMADLLTEGQCEEVYQLNVQLFPLTQEEDS